jgi:aldehyde dehydrogenase (NAD+)
MDPGGACITSSAKILFKMADLMDERAEDFAIREAMDMGMP